MSYTLSLLIPLWILERPTSADQRTIGPALHQWSTISNQVPQVPWKEGETYNGTGGTGVFIGSIRPLPRYPPLFTFSTESRSSKLWTADVLTG